MTRIAVVTGASAGVGQATVRQLAEAGYHVYFGARRVDRLTKLAADVGGTAIALDVADADSVRAFCESVPECRLLVNCAGIAVGVEPIIDTTDESWQQTYEVNVIGVVRMVKQLMPKLIASGDGHVISIGSTAAHFEYAGGGGYLASKHALSAVMKSLRGELLGQPVRFTEIDPGIIESEFNLARFGGDQARSDSVYEGKQALTPEDVAECIVWSASRPPNVNINEIVVTPRNQSFGFGSTLLRSS